ncbi:hypothetical protein KKG05_10020 [bacterium]|nr:hypothetical protein [Pseudomonadota bacterium]MBU1937721.1 hypothetical protein [bacterium]
MPSKINWEKLDREVREIKPIPADPKKMAQYNSKTAKELKVFLAKQARYREHSELEAKKVRFN